MSSEITPPSTANENGHLFVVCAASGTGKTSLVQGLVEREADVSLSISHTTRTPREGEHDGVHYHFVDEKRFEAMVAENGFLEHAKVYGNYYGTSVGSVRGLLEQGRDVVLEIDWQGAQQVRKHIGKCSSIFILPPSLESLRARLQGRGKDSMAVIEARLAEAITDISHYNEFDYLVINDRYEIALDEIRGIIRSDRLRSERQIANRKDLLARLLVATTPT